MLQGQHLVVVEPRWEPFGIPDANATHGWSGFDIDLLDLVAKRLNFSFEIHEMEFAPEDDGSWTSLLFRSLKTADLALSYWIKSPERMNHVMMSGGHVDTSTVLIGRLDYKENGSVLENLTRFLDPFALELWLALFCLVIISGFVDFVTENSHVGRAMDSHVEGHGIKRATRMLTVAANKYGNSFGESMYEYVAGALWGGWDAPKNKTSSFFQVSIAFIMLIAVSCYTANLAAFITLGAKPTLSVSSLRIMLADSQPACVISHWPMLSAFRELNPMLYLDVHPTVADVRDKLASKQGCDAVITQGDNLRMWKLNSDFCRLQKVETLSSQLAGWATVRDNWCVHQAVDWAVETLKLEGQIERLNLKWLKPALCKKEADKIIKNDLPEGLSRMEVSEFAGMFLLWGCCAFAALASTTLQACRQRLEHRRMASNQPDDAEVAGPCEWEVDEADRATITTDEAVDEADHATTTTDEAVDEADFSPAPPDENPANELPPAPATSGGRIESITAI
eukprot:TRINITY_DN6177_c0_g1_i2.p1 TRINITY_DN6177_c0_g1~~TRINITY_DN6177_c0_g1_i2.p1  ORF type:complete len:555 (-),score=100.49 TRINITY_DN6177_c0_g1_i2:330-1856(-)